MAYMAYICIHGVYNRRWADNDLRSERAAHGRTCDQSQTPENATMTRGRGLREHMERKALSSLVLDVPLGVF